MRVRILNILNSEAGIRKSEKRWSFSHLPCAVRLQPIIILFFIFASWTVWGLESNKANPGSLTATLDQASVPVGGVVWLALDYRLPEGGRLPEKPTVKGLDGLTVLNQIINPRR